jgi:pimeloyl-ACP methyl ester carboxylesterase
MKRVAVFVLVGVIVSAQWIAAQTPSAQLFPILFVHGFCSSSDTWTVMTSSLSGVNPARYGTAVTRLTASTSFPGQDATRKLFTIDFLGPTGGADPREAAQVSIAAKAIELKRVINEIKRITGQPKVIVVGHSLGGLVARWYIQRGAGTAPYEGDVAALATIDSPHLGTNLAVFDERALELDTFLQCLLIPSTNRTELAPGSATLTTLNATPLAVNTPVASIASWQSEFPNPRTDGVVPFQSQNLLSVYPQLANAVVFLLDNPVSLGPTQQILHILVNQLPSTIGLINLVVTAVDRLQGSAPPPSAGLPGPPQLATATAGGLITLGWAAAATGGTPTGYVLRGTYQSAGGAVPLPFELPVGPATSIAVPPTLLGSFTVRVFAVNAAGEGPASNQVAFTNPPGQ